jgi:hypothetical protein
MERQNLKTGFCERPGKEIQDRQRCRQYSHSLSGKRIMALTGHGSERMRYLPHIESRSGCRLISLEKSLARLPTFPMEERLNLLVVQGSP